MTNKVAKSKSSSEFSIKRIFISYAREDLQWAKEMARISRNLGLEVFIDVESIRAGEDYPKVLDEELKKPDLIWLGWSKYSSQSSWVRREYEVALKKWPGHLRIDFLDKTPLPEELKHIQAETSILAQTGSEDLLRDPIRELPNQTKQPSFLLRPEYRVVPFHGREEILADLKKWCISGKAFSVQLITGPGGVGKTRLLIEACSRMRAEKWETGFLDAPKFDESQVGQPSNIDKLFWPRLPRLIVIDYAETRRHQVEAL